MGRSIRLVTDGNVQDLSRQKKAKEGRWEEGSNSGPGRSYRYDVGSKRKMLYIAGLCSIALAKLPGGTQAVERCLFDDYEPGQLTGCLT